MADEEQLVPGEDDQDMPDALTKSLETLQLPFPVATITDLEQRAYMTAGGGLQNGSSAGPMSFAKLGLILEGT